MSNVSFIRALEPSGVLLPYFTALVPAGFPSPALDHMEHKLSLDDLLDLHAPHIFVVRCCQSQPMFHSDQGSHSPAPSSGKFCGDTGTKMREPTRQLRRKRAHGAIF